VLKNTGSKGKKKTFQGRKKKGSQKKKNKGKNLAQEAAASDTKKLVQEKERGTIAIQIAKKKKKNAGRNQSQAPRR